MTTIRLPPVLRPEAGGQRQLQVEAPTIRAALEQLVEQYPALRGRVIDRDDVPPFLNVFVDGENMRVLEGLETAVTPQTTILILPAVAGGSSPRAEAPPPSRAPIAWPGDLRPSG